MMAPRARGNTRRSVTWEYRLIFLASLPLFLVGEVLRRCWFSAGHLHDRARAPKSIFAAAKEQAATSLPYAFLG